MESLRFEGSTVEQCLKSASDRLNISVENIDYIILEEKKGLFRKKAVISVQFNIVCDDINSGTVAVKEGKLIIKNPISEGKPAVIIPGENIKLIIDGEEVKARHEVFEDSIIEVLFDETEAKRHMHLNVSEDKITAYIDINYEPQIIYGLKEKEESCSITLEQFVEREIYPPFYTKEEINTELAKLGIEYGIIKDNLKKCVENTFVSNLLIAQGIPPEDDADDFLELKFSRADVMEGFIEDKSGRVDYRNVGSVKAVKKGDIIAIKHEGHEGHHGTDVYGNTVKKRSRKLINLRVGNGCALKDPNTVVASIDGKPCIKNSTFYVYEVHEVQQDVDLSTGNVKFIGDVLVYGGIREGMAVEAGNVIQVEDNVESARLEAKGNIEVKGSVMLSTIVAGGQDVIILGYIDRLSNLKITLTNLVEAIIEIKKFNLLGQKATDGEMIKLLMENKFKNIVKLCSDIISMSKILGSDNSMAVQLIREKLVGMTPLEINHFSELDLVIEHLQMEMEEMQNNISLPVNVNVAYLQDSKVNSSGDIYITGKGEYVSELIAHGSIHFIAERSVARGGVLNAKNEMKCKTVGSTGGVTTKLAVSEKGHIWIDEAYQNTVLVVGKKEFILEIPSKNIHAYLDDKGDLIIDRLNL